MRMKCLVLAFGFMGEGMAETKLHEIREWVKKNISPARLRHIRGVARVAVELAVRHRVDPKKAELAAWLHDCAKEMPHARMKLLIGRGPFRLDPTEIRLAQLWHPLAGAAMARQKWRIRDQEVLEAVRCHTLGKAGMKPLAQVIFVADFIEPGRKFKGAAEVQKKAMKDLGQGVAAKASMTVGFLLKKNMMIHSRLLDTWNDFIKKRTNV
jgi:predicted HD superfamily hydrolase involved in NAD metabolism